MYSPPNSPIDTNGLLGYQLNGISDFVWRYAFIGNGVNISCVHIDKYLVRLQRYENNLIFV